MDPDFVSPDAVLRTVLWIARGCPFVDRCYREPSWQYLRWNYLQLTEADVAWPWAHRCYNAGLYRVCIFGSDIVECECDYIDSDSQAGSDADGSETDSEEIY